MSVIPLKGGGAAPACLRSGRDEGCPLRLPAPDIGVDTFDNAEFDIPAADYMPACQRLRIHEMHQICSFLLERMPGSSLPGLFASLLGVLLRIAASARVASRLMQHPSTPFVNGVQLRCRHTSFVPRSHRCLPAPTSQAPR